ncbi:hypothetical protein DFJ74DRAFT_690592 [Hyaloraphidium curvatum]|nr:hypothetical protein DFJ74DRAFT_690592 [Hyaloraphidium curvatum]
MERPIPRLPPDALPTPPRRRLPPVLQYPPNADAISQLPVHPDLLEERAKATFAIRDLTHVLHGGADNFAKYEHYRAIVEEDPVLESMNKIRSYFLPRKEHVFNGWRKIKRLKELRMQHSWSRAELDMAIAALNESLPINQSDGIFKGAIATNGSDEQVNAWFKLADNWQTLGSYGQTELGHGSNVSALETTATYDPESQTFDLHSPTLTSAKFWPGGLALTGTHSVVYAQLVLPGNKKMGVNPFYVQLRDPDTGDWLPGIKSMDLGPKMAYAALDNGFCYFSHVQIPLTALLSRAVTLSPDGVFTRNPAYDSRNHFATMLLTRIAIGMSYGICLASGCTIATRYTCIRRQFGNDSKGKELKVLDYPSMRMRVLVPLAASFAFHFAGQALSRLAEPLRKGDFRMLQELHAASSCLKVSGSLYATGGLEELRRAQGGLGFSLLSGMPSFVGQIARLNTVEGDTYVLTQQTARWLLKQAASLLKPQKQKGTDADAKIELPITVDYLERLKVVDHEKCAATRREDFRKPEVQLHAVSHWALRSLKDLYDEVEVNGRQLTDSLLLVDPCAVSHGYALVSRYFDADVSAMESDPSHPSAEYVKSSPSLLPIFRKLQSLFNLSLLVVAVTPLSHIMAPATLLLGDGYLNGEQLGWIRAEIRSLLDEIRPYAVSLADAWAISDRQLGSLTGRYDGRCYENLADVLSKYEPLNTDSAEVRKVWLDTIGWCRKAGLESVLQEIERGRRPGWKL